MAQRALTAVGWDWPACSDCPRKSNRRFPVPAGGRGSPERKKAPKWPAEPQTSGMQLRPACFTPALRARIGRRGPGVPSVPAP